MAAKKMTMGVIIGNRGFFPDQLAKSGREEMIQALAKAGMDCVVLGPEEFPGYKSERVVCAECHEGINFKREVLRDGRVLCKACAGERYYEPL